ncbi:MAG: hypothetical protein IPQ07_21420 [Myxococcales bacterium]|nr:hypothetical protein [Myxococcales bacterium]
MRFALVGVVIAVFAVIGACGGRSEPTPAKVPAPTDPVAAPVAPPPKGAPPAPAPPPAPPPGVDLVVVAKITNAGPIGDGRCSQRSYEITLERVVAGATPTTPTLWVHFEVCGTERKPQPAGELAGTGLDVGARYQFALKKGASGNFGDGLMITSARAP